MPLERFRRSRVVVLGRQSTVYQAARAMADNHIGSVLVNQRSGLAGIVTDRDLALAVFAGELDPHSTTLGEVMSEEVVTCGADAEIGDVVRLMRDNGVRRIPLVEGEKVVGLVTFDDLVLEEAVDLEALRGIVLAQLEAEAPLKPAGEIGPAASPSAEGRARALIRAKARAEATYRRLVEEIAQATGLDRERSERALLVVACILCRRLTPQEARHLVAQLPSLLQLRLENCLDGPDRSVTARTMADELARSVAGDRDGAHETLRAVLKVVSDNVSKGQVAEVRGQLPEDMKGLFPALV